MLETPYRLISNEEKVLLIGENFCPNCTLNRRTNITELLTPGGELDADVFRSKDIFGLSVNVYLCNTSELEIESYPDDVNIVPIDINPTAFLSDAQLRDIKFDALHFEKKDTLIAFMLAHKILEVKGTYPFKKGTPDEVIYNFKLKIQHHPNILNAFHFQVEVVSNETGEWKEISRSNKKNYIRSLASSIKNRILKERIIRPLYSR